MVCIAWQGFQGFGKESEIERDGRNEYNKSYRRIRQVR